MDAEKSELKPVVLIVDDNDEIRCVLRLLFELEDFVVTEASSGPQAVTRVLQHTPNFIVLDYLMPGMNGDKVAPVLRSLVPEARIVAFSSFLKEKPVWADSFLNKDRVGEISSLLGAVLPAARFRRWQSETRARKHLTIAGSSHDRG